ncbi:MAG: thioredoxin family protein [Eubacteriales bacterium]|nr:thioredoxin family protein [Eubacteriales bacterium]
MSDRQKVIEVEEGSTCFNAGSLPHYDVKSESKFEQESGEQKPRIFVLGAGCPKCRALEQAVLSALGEMNLQEPVGHITDYAEMAKYGVMSTPALVIDGKVVSVGRALNAQEVLKLLQSANLD